MKVLLIIVLFLTLVTDSVLSLDEELLDPFGCNETLFDTKTCHRVSYDYYCTISRSTQDWFRELYNEALADGPRTRKEIRTLDDAERQAYIDAVVALKNDKVGYDFTLCTEFMIRTHVHGLRFQQIICQMVKVQPRVLVKLTKSDKQRSLL